MMLEGDHVSAAETASSSDMMGDDHSSDEEGGISGLKRSAAKRQSSLSPLCDACPHCRDCCDNDDCDRCERKRLLEDDARSSSSVAVRACPPCPGNADKKPHRVYRYYTRCQVRRHNHEGSCWLIAGDAIYDATPVMKTHPGGPKSLLKRGGGVEDCTVDLQFHSRSGRKVWDKYRIGTLKECCGAAGGGEKSNKPWWALWA